MIEDDYEIVRSPREQQVTKNGVSVEIHIYRGPEDDGWLLEIQDHTGGSAIWDETFPDDKAAFDTAMATIVEEGIGSFAAAHSNPSEPPPRPSLVPDPTE